MKPLKNRESAPISVGMIRVAPSSLRRTRPGRGWTATTCRSRRLAEHRSERGAAIVEFALVAVVLFAVITGLIDGGLLVRARNSTASVADEGARRGAIAGVDESADWEVLQQIIRRGALRQAQVNYVVIFNAATGNAQPTPACLGGTAVADECNVYYPSDFDAPVASFDCSNSGLDANWCPGDRAGDSDFAYIGVHIDASYEGLLGNFMDFRVNATAVRPLEESGGI